MHILYNCIGGIMDEDITFKNTSELYKRVLPALYSKVKELQRIGFRNINEKDIWNYLVDNEWKNKQNLELHVMINDILYLDNYTINEFIQKSMSKLKKKTKQDIKDINVSQEGEYL